MRKLSKEQVLVKYPLSDDYVFTDGGTRTYMKLEFDIDIYEGSSYFTRPNNVAYDKKTKTLIVFEWKGQESNGSVDHAKIIFSAYKKHQWEGALLNSGVTLKYVLLLGAYYNDSKYVDVIEYAKNNGVIVSQDS